MNTIALLTDTQLHENLVTLVRQEKECTENIIRHLAAVLERRLYVKLGYSSVFDYTVRGLGYSPAAAQRRINVAHAAKENKKVCEYLEQGRISLCAVERCAEALRKAGGKELLEELCGKSKAEAERMALALRSSAPRETRDRIEPMALRFENPTKKLFSSTGGKNDEVTEKFRVSFTASASFKAKLERAQELNFKGAKEDLLLENVLSEALDLYIAKHCPKERIKRRRARLAKRQASRPGPGVKLSRGLKPAPSRYIPAQLRDEVFERDEYQCTYESKTGIRCECKVNLELDHIVPIARGGTTTKDNIRLLCQTHNLQAAMELFGEEFVAKRIGFSGG